MPQQHFHLGRGDVMNVIYQGIDISNSIDIIKADICDNASGVADNIELVASDIEKLWNKWKPQKNDTIIIKQGSFSSGTMFVDHIEQSPGKFVIKAISVPLEAKTPNSRYWEHVRFLELAKDIASKYGFIVETFGITNWLYENVAQIEQADFEFLHYRCLLEGYCLKITDKKVVIYDERYLEQQAIVKSIYLDDLGTDYEMKSVAVGLHNSCEVQCSRAEGVITSIYKPQIALVGPILKKNIYLSDQAEADRFARGLLRYANKFEISGRIQIEPDTGLAAGCNVKLVDAGLMDGKNFVYQTIHKLVSNKTVLRLRKPLEGY
jgi:hypothetical protein